MCYNKESSFTSFFMSWVIGIYLWNRNFKFDRWNGIFLLTFSSIQILDTILWIEYENCKDFNTDINLIVTKYFIPLILSSEAIVQYVGSIYYKNGTLNDTINNLMNNKTFYVYAAYSITFLLYVSTKFKYTTLSKNKNLRWDGRKHDILRNKLYGIVFLSFLIYPYLGNNSNTLNLLAIFTFLSFAWSIIKTDTWAANWCWLGNFSSLIMLFSPYIENYNI